MVLGYGAFSAVDTNGDALAGGEYEIIAVNAFYKLRIDQVAAVASEQRISDLLLKRCHGCVRRYGASGKMNGDGVTFWPMIIIGIFFFIDAVIYGILFMQADKYHVEIFEEHVEGLSLCLTGGIREINVPYTQVQGVTVAEKQCALVLQLAGRQETMYCPDVETTKQMGQYINGRIRASYR